MKVNFRILKFMSTDTDERGASLKWITRIKV